MYMSSSNIVNMNQTRVLNMLVIVGHVLADKRARDPSGQHAHEIQPKLVGPINGRFLSQRLGDKVWAPKRPLPPYKLHISPGTLVNQARWARFSSHTCSRDAGGVHHAPNGLDIRAGPQDALQARCDPFDLHILGLCLLKIQRMGHVEKPDAAIDGGPEGLGTVEVRIEDA
ncbi:transducin/WD40 repeat-like superfamily protein [Striga asiatica]|uniref:Transducin/WD40 repeat-like superfamily protein n=1 Tax=Striga asiatica TaxID=4170 RepID=A0A5A7RK27_STRAF|nr:transducin/WD40 repeat-like superfamily protein [Striga asiatica]